MRHEELRLRRLDPLPGERRHFAALPQTEKPPAHSCRRLCFVFA